MSKMSELDYEQRMAADQPRPSLREAAQAVIDRWFSPNWASATSAPHTGELIAALRDALAEDALACLSETHQQLDAALEYERIGRILGTYGGRLVFIPDNRATVWPDGTAVYVRRGSSPKIGEQLGEVRKKIGGQPVWEAMLVQRATLMATVERLLEFEPEHCPCGFSGCNEPKNAWGAAISVVETIRRGQE